VFDRLSTPAAIQQFLDSIPYSTDPNYRSPRSVLRDGRAHCFDGAVFAAAALERLGYPPRLVNQHAVRDDDHVLALFGERGHWGAIAKSNFVTLRFREPVFRSVRELVMSYFEFYFNTEAEKTLRAFSQPVALRRFDRLGWRLHDEAMDSIAQRLDRSPHRSILTPAMARRLAPVDELTLRAAMLGTDPAGLYRPDPR
jgi:hypothetical protein